MLRFVLGVMVLMAAFYALYHPKWELDPVGKFLSYNLAMHAHASGAVLRCLGNENTVLPAGPSRGPTIQSPRFPIEIVRGCDALEPLALFLAAVLAFPVSWRAKLVGAIAGIILMEVTNIVRIVSLFYVGVYWRPQFKMMHEEVWQAAFIVISVVYWGLWALWATRPDRSPASPAVTPAVQPACS